MYFIHKSEVKLKSAFKSNQSFLNQVKNMDY